MVVNFISTKINIWGLAGFAELSSELINAARAHCELIIVTK